MDLNISFTYFISADAYVKTKVLKSSDAFTVHEKPKHHSKAAKINDLEEVPPINGEYTNSREGITQNNLRARNPFEIYLLSEPVVKYIKEILENSEEENVDSP